MSPRIRTVKPEFWQDEKMSAAPIIDRLVFLGLIGMADDAGRLLDNVKVIDAWVFSATDDTCQNSLVRLAVSGRIRRGVTDSGQNVIQVANWDRHQKIEKPNLKAALPKIVKDNALVAPSTTLLRSIPDEAENHTNDRHTNDRHTNDQRPTTDDRAPSPSNGRWQVGDAYHDDATRFLAKVPDKLSWDAELMVAFTGMHGRQPLTPDQLGQAIRDYLGSGALNQPNPSIRHFQAFLKRAGVPGKEPEGEWVPPEERPGTPEYRRAHA